MRGVMARAPERRGTIGRGTSGTRPLRPHPHTRGTGGTRTTPRHSPSCPRATGTSPNTGPPSRRPRAQATAPRGPTTPRPSQDHPGQPELYPRPAARPRRRGGLPATQECPRHPSPHGGITPGPRGPARPPCGPATPPPRPHRASPRDRARPPRDRHREAVDRAPRPRRLDRHNGLTVRPATPPTPPRRLTRRVLDARAAPCYKFHRSPAFHGWATRPGVAKRAGRLHLGSLYRAPRRPSSR